MKYRKLGKTGLDVSVLSFGASSLGSVFRETNEAESIRTVHTAVDLGINLIDVSPYYGLTKAETVLGKAIAQMDRQRFILTTKAGRYGDAEFDFSKERIIRSVDESLKRLQTDYIDILYLHDIEFAAFDEIVEEGFPALDALKQSGKIRYLGVSGLPLTVFEKSLAIKEMDSVLSYCHYALNDTSLLDVLPLLEQHQVGLVSASPLSMGLLSTRPAADWHPAPADIRRICKEAAEFCASRGMDIAKLAVQYATANERIPTTLVSTASPENISKNIAWTDEPMDTGLLREVLDILKPIHNKSWVSGRAEYNEKTYV
ncbi:aldo/keto reductase [Paenibacillus sp. CGMCC 1.16610]|uniref:Aldo/keto reductase n=1 Tax=Paenibacillus anseongense TaxID=2682845 RepID=A0ABW9UGT3_9BACL|nr:MULTISPECIES: aldo/keto reductase [Paenibacillus]MBA2942651.1 aldo/keto reductase [Paenibacillus sp. CGMCC 1.16610]MVQ38480.1 aldo/keto reductase [Paenibacillus anseongense]